jgi:hypothetical protein
MELAGHLNQTVAGLAILQGFDVIGFERKTLQVGKLMRIAEHPEGQIVGKLSKALEIAGKPEVALRSSVDVDRANQKDLGRRAGRQGLRNRLPASKGGNLILTEPDVLLKECLQVRIRLRKARQGGRGHQGQQCNSARTAADHGNFTPGLPLHFSWCLPSASSNATTSGSL